MNPDNPQFKKSKKESSIYRKGNRADTARLREAASRQRASDEVNAEGNRLHIDDQTGYSGAKMAFTPFSGGITKNTKALPVSGTELAKEAAKRKSGAIDKFGMKNNEHQVDSKKRYNTGAY